MFRRLLRPFVGFALLSLFVATAFATKRGSDAVRRQHGGDRRMQTGAKPVILAPTASLGIPVIVTHHFEVEFLLVRCDRLLRA